MHDELRRLDEELAAGRLDADSYRRRRDDLLAARLSDPPPPGPSPGTDPAGAASPDAPLEVAPVDAAPRGAAAPKAAPVDAAPRGAASPKVAPVDAAPRGAASPKVAPGDAAPRGAASPEATPVDAADARDPFPPPFRWNGSGDAAHGSGSGDDRSGAAADATQVVAARTVLGADEAPERTQVVRGGAEDAVPPGAADATQVVGRPPARLPGPRRDIPRAGPLDPPAPPERTQFVPGAALTRAGDLRSVPARRTVPPWADERSAAPGDPRRPGREVFARRRGPSPAAVVGTAALVLVVLVVLTLSFLLG